MHTKDQYILYINRLVHMTCTLLKVRCPYIYFVNYEDDFTLYDNNFNKISYSNKDSVPYKIQAVKFISKEYTIYINTSILNDEILASFLIIRQCRSIFQLKQIIYQSKWFPIDVQGALANEWTFCYNISKTKPEYTFDIPIEIDRNAFSSILIKALYNIDIRFEKNRGMERLKERTNELGYDYDIIKIWNVANQYGIEIKYIPEYNINKLFK